MSNAEEIENKIREKRILEATKKGLMGKNGKIGTVLRVLGQPIVNQSEGGFYLDSNYINLGAHEDKKNLHEIQDAKELMKNIPIMGDENSQRPSSEEWTNDMPDPIQFGFDIIGFYFEGLNRGMHLEIKYDEISSELLVYYKGFVVYKEIKGELLGYYPVDEWEKWIESLYKISKEKQRSEKEKEFEEAIIKSKKEKNEWWIKIKNKWGIK